MHNNLEELRDLYKEDRFATNIGAEIDEVGDNYAICSLKLNSNHYNRCHEVMGGVIFTLADFAFAVAANHEDLIAVTSTSKVLYLSGTKSSTIFAEAREVKKGMSNCFYDVTVTDTEGKKIAFLQFTGAIVKH